MRNRSPARTSSDRRGGGTCAVWLLLGLVCLMGASGCATVKMYKGTHLFEKAVVIEGVPGVVQDRDLSCGPACLAGVGLYYGADVLSVIKPGEAERFSADFSGKDLCALGEKLNLKAYCYEGTPANLEENLASGRPVIVLLRSRELTRPWYVLSRIGWMVGRWVTPNPDHWVVALGYTGKSFIIHDPAEGRLEIKRSTFLREWRSNESAAILVVPPSDSLAHEKREPGRKAFSSLEDREEKH